MSESDQTEYVQSVVKDLRQRATEPRSNRYHYWTAEMKVLKGSCEIGYQMMTALKAEFESKYGNRPAMMQWLAGV